MSIWSEQDIATLKTAIASGVLTVSYDGPPKRLVTHQSLSEMRALLASMLAEQSASSGGSSYRLGAFRKGL